MAETQIPTPLDHDPEPKLTLYEIELLLGSVLFTMTGADPKRESLKAKLWSMFRAARRAEEEQQERGAPEGSAS